jgi:hypothetical protein
MKRGQDYRPYVEGCELYMRLQSSRFPTEEHRVLWAMGFLQGDRATEWARAYRRRMKKDPHYVSWRVYKSRLQRDSRLKKKTMTPSARCEASSIETTLRSTSAE